MSRTYVHFLGYSEAEGGIQEIITDNTFSMGAIDLETGEREFDEIEFDVPMIDILKVKPSSENEAGTLMTSLISLKGQADDHINTNVHIADIELDAGDLIWVENERVESVNAFSDYDEYSIKRGRNGSIPITHISEYIENEMDVITVTRKRISPIGLIVKIYTKSKVLAYGQLTGISIKNTGLVTCKCKNIYDVDSVLYLRGDLVRDWNNGYINMSALIYYRVNEFFTKMEIPSLLMDYKVNMEIVENNDFWYRVDNAKDFINQTMAINNSFLKFKDGMYKLGSFSRKINSNLITTATLTKEVVAGGTIDFELNSPYSSVSVKTADSEEPYKVWTDDSNFTRSYTSTKKVELDLSAMVLPESDMSTYEQIRDIARSKLYMLNNVIEFMTITVPKRSEVFEIGEFYKFTDIGRYKSFYDNYSDNGFFCFSVDEGSVKLARTLSIETRLVAPSLFITKTGTYTYDVYDLNNLGDYIYTDNYIDGISGLTNVNDGNLMFEATDKVTLIDANGTVYESEISAITDSEVTLNSTITGSVGDMYILTIESENGTLKAKNQVYFYDNNEGVL